MHKPIQVSVYIDDNCWAGLAILIKEALGLATDVSLDPYSITRFATGSLLVGKYGSGAVS